MRIRCRAAAERKVDIRCHDDQYWPRFTLSSFHSTEADDEEDLRRVAAYFEHVLRNAPELAAGGAGVVEDEAMLLATVDGQILYLSDSAGALLDQLAAQERELFNRRTLLPFCLRLVESVAHGDRYPWLLPLGTLAMAGGALEARAQWMSVGGGRESARANMEVSDAVLRDCVKAVYEKFGCSSEAGLLEQLRPTVARM